MDSVLKKTVASLETALKYNPDNLDLMTSLAEGYIRLGRLDADVLQLCERVLARQPANAMLQQAQAVAFVIDQADQIDAGLAEDRPPPPPEDIRSSLEILNEFMQTMGDNTAVIFAWTRLQTLSGNLKDALAGLEKLKQAGHDRLGELRRELDWIGAHPPEDQDWTTLIDLYREIGLENIGLRHLEETLDEGRAQETVGPLLLGLYLKKYSPATPDQVPEATRPRLFQLLLDHGDPVETGKWLRKASLFGWEITSYSKVYVQELIRDRELETAFEILQRMLMDHDVKNLLNEIAQIHEDEDRIDDAVTVLQYINNHELVETDLERRQEAELAREMELSLAELHLKNDRINDALLKFVSALCLSDEPDPAIVDRIDELLSTAHDHDPGALLRLASYFRKLKDHPKTVFYLNHVLEFDPQHSEALHELEALFDEILVANPENPELRLELGKVQQKLGHPEKAVEEFQNAAQHPPLAERANRALALLYKEMGKTNEALARYQEIDLLEEDLEPLYQLHLDFMKKEEQRAALIALDLITRVRADFRDVTTRIRQIEDRGERPQVDLSPGDARMRELIGEMAIGRYRYIEKIGTGGMGVVHKVLDLKQKKTVAMKILRDGLSGSSKALDRFFREARIAASVHHRNIVDIFDYNISSVTGQSYISMEYVDGPSLRQVIDEHFEASMPVDIDYITEMLYYLVQVFDALEVTHAKGIIHRDIKPDNIMINSFGEVKITDFGIVHVEEATFTPTGAMLGTPRYMSPEQVTGGKLDGRSDIYSTGILLYEVLTGAPPFVTGDISYQQVNKTPIEPRAMCSAIPQSVSDFILKTLSKQPDERFAAARDAKASLSEILDALGGCRKFNCQTALGDAPQSTPESNGAQGFSPSSTPRPASAAPAPEAQKVATHGKNATPSVNPDLDEDLDLD